MSAGENPFGDLLQDYIVECLPLAEQVGDAFVELERHWRDGEPGEELREHVGEFVDNKKAGWDEAVNEGRAAAEQARAEMVSDHGATEGAAL